MKNSSRKNGAFEWKNLTKFRKIQKCRLTWALIQIEKHDKLTPLHHIGKTTKEKAAEK